MIEINVFRKAWSQISSKLQETDLDILRKVESCEVWFMKTFETKQNKLEEFLSFFVFLLYLNCRVIW